MSDFNLGACGCCDGDGAGGCDDCKKFFRDCLHGLWGLTGKVLHKDAEITFSVGSPDPVNPPCCSTFLGGTIVIPGPFTLNAECQVSGHIDFEDDVSACSVAFVLEAGRVQIGYSRRAGFAFGSSNFASLRDGPCSAGCLDWNPAYWQFGNSYCGSGSGDTATLTFV